MLQAQLKDVPFFSSLSKRELTTVAQNTDELDIAQGKALAREGEFGHEFFVIVEGTAEVVRGGTHVADLHSCDFFGEMALLGEERRTATVTATSPMRVLVMTGQHLRAIDREMPAVHTKIVEAIEARRAAMQASPS
jgi:CRP/FNR family transcriptional regulator, cyclic AMP receptor protein